MGKCIRIFYIKFYKMLQNEPGEGHLAPKWTQNRPLKAPRVPRKGGKHQREKRSGSSPQRPPLFAPKVAQVTAIWRLRGPLGRLGSVLEAAEGTPKRRRAAEERAGGAQEGARDAQGRQNRTQKRPKDLPKTRETTERRNTQIIEKPM